MIGNLLTMMGIVNPAPAVPAVGNGVAAAVEGGDNSLFGNLLTTANAEGLAENLIDEILVPDAEITEQSLAGLLSQGGQDKKDVASILDTNNAQSLIANVTVAQIDNILSNEPSLAAINNNNVFTKIVTEDAIQELGINNQNLSQLAEPTVKSLDELAKIATAQSNADKNADLSSIENKLVNKNFIAKQDERIFGQDNLENMAYFTKQDYLSKASEIVAAKNPFGIPENSALFRNANNADGTPTESKNSLFVGAENIFGKHADNITKYAVNQKTSEFKDSLADATYKIVHIAKNDNVIDLKLEPANLGKVQIRFDFGADGKANIAVFADRKDTLDIFQKDSSALQKILQDSGIKADSGSLSFNLRGENGAGGQYAQNDWANQGNPFAFSLEQDLNNIISVNDTNNYVVSANSASLYNENLAQGMLSILV